MSRDPRQYSVISSRDLSESERGIAFCTICKNPVYDGRRYRGDRALRAEAKRGWITFATTMHVVMGPDGEGDICGSCVLDPAGDRAGGQGCC